MVGCDVDGENGELCSCESTCVDGDSILHHDGDYGPQNDGARDLNHHDGGDPCDDVELYVVHVPADESAWWQRWSPFQPTDQVHVATRGPRM